AFFQKTQAGAIDFATDSTANNGHLSLTGTYIEGWNGVNADNVFTVGVGTNGSALSVNTAMDNANASSVINVLNGTYAEDVSVIAPRTLNFDDATLDSLSVLATGAGSTLSGSVKAGSVTAFDIALGGDLALDTSAAN